MSDAPTIHDSTPLFQLLADLENRAKVYADDDPADPRGKVYRSVVAQLKQALEVGSQRVQWKSPNELSTQLGVKVDTIRSWARSNKIQWRRIPGTRIMQVRYASGGAN